MRQLMLCAPIIAPIMASCSPVATINVVVRSNTHIEFNVAANDGSPACIDYLTVRGVDSAFLWELRRVRNGIGCINRIVFPTVPDEFEAASNQRSLTNGNYEVDVSASIYGGIARFHVP